MIGTQKLYAWLASLWLHTAPPAQPRNTLIVPTIERSVSEYAASVLVNHVEPPSQQDTNSMTLSIATIGTQLEDLVTGKTPSFEAFEAEVKADLGELEAAVPAAVKPVVTAAVTDVVNAGSSLTGLAATEAGALIAKELPNAETFLVNSISAILGVVEGVSPAPLSIAEKAVAQLAITAIQAKISQVGASILAGAPAVVAEVKQAAAEAPKALDPAE